MNNLRSPETAVVKSLGGERFDQRLQNIVIRCDGKGYDEPTNNNMNILMTLSCNVKNGNVDI